MSLILLETQYRNSEMGKSTLYQRELRARRKKQGFKTLTRYVKPSWIQYIDKLINVLENENI